MFFTRILHKLCGYINIKIEGGNPEKFINLCIKDDINIFNLKKDEFAFYASTFRKNAKKLDAISKKCGTNVTIVADKGVPVLFVRNRKRWGFFVGIAVFAALMIYFSGFIWNVQIHGNSSVSSERIVNTLDDLGLSSGVRSGTFDVKEVEQEALLKIPELSWMHINLDGTVAIVEVGERTNVPELVADNVPCNIRASQSGQIVRIQVANGVTKVKVNDTVNEGEVVVSGVIEEPKTFITHFVHSRAEVIARTNHKFEISVPFKTSKMEDTGKVVDRYTLRFLDLRIPLYFNTPKGSFRRMVYKEPLVIFGNELPIGIIKTSFYEYSEVPVTLTKDEALIKAKSLIERKEKTELCSAKIINKTYAANYSKNGLIYTGTYTCEEDIGAEQEINVAFS